MKKVIWLMVLIAILGPSVTFALGMLVVTWTGGLQPFSQEWLKEAELAAALTLLGWSILLLLIHAVTRFLRKGGVKESK